MHIRCWWVYLLECMYVCGTLAFWLRSYVYGLVMMWLTGPKWDGDPLTPPLSRPGPPALWNVIHHPLGLLPPTLYPVAMAMLMVMATSTGTGTVTETGNTPLTHTGPPVTAWHRDSTTMHYHQQVRTKLNISLAHCPKTWICSHFQSVFKGIVWIIWGGVA